MKLSIGEVTVVRPDLRGWDVMLSSVPETVLNAVMQSIREAAAVQEANVGKQQEALMRIGLKLLPLFQSSPILLAAIAQATLRTPDGKPITREAAWSMTDADVDDMITAIMESEWRKDFGKRLKNRLSGAARLAAAPALTPT